MAFVSVSDSDVGIAGQVEASLDTNDDFGLEVVDKSANRFVRIFRSFCN